MIFTVFAPSGVTVIPVPPSPPAAASAPNEMNAVALIWSTLALAVDE